MNPYESENGSDESHPTLFHQRRHIPLIIVVIFLTTGVLIGFALATLGFLSINPFSSWRE